MQSSRNHTVMDVLSLMDGNNVNLCIHQTSVHDRR